MTFTVFGQGVRLDGGWWVGGWVVVFAETKDQQGLINKQELFRINIQLFGLFETLSLLLCIYLVSFQICNLVTGVCYWLIGLLEFALVLFCVILTTFQDLLRVTYLISNQF